MLYATLILYILVDIFIPFGCFSKPIFALKLWAQACLFRQHAASIYGFVRQFRQLRLSKKNLCVRSLGYIVGASPPCENMCVRSLGYIVGASPPSMKICVSVRWGILWVHPPLCWILACCLLRFAAFFPLNANFGVKFSFKYTYDIGWLWSTYKSLLPLNDRL